MQFQKKNELRYSWLDRSSEKNGCVRNICIIKFKKTKKNHSKQCILKKIHVMKACNVIDSFENLN